ncbi:MAG: flagellar motor protein MotB, partial [Bacteroidales bacterium]
MKNTFYLLASSILLSGLLFTSCGPSKKLVESRNRVAKLQNDSANTHNQMNDCNTLVKNLNTEKANLQNENATVQKDLKAINNQSKMTIADQAIRLQNLQKLIQSQKDVMNNLKNSIADALLNYSADELTVYIKDGNVYVSLQEKLLFKSGSDVVDPKGIEALQKLAKVLNSTTDIAVLIEG